MKYHWRADTTGIATWISLSILAYLYFKTDIVVILWASLAGIYASFPISLMVGTSILMITYMQQTGALKRVIIFFKTLGGGGSKGFQIMFLNLGLGTFLVSIGATPISILPPIMIALGFSSFVAVALPAIGYDPLTTFALFSIPAVVFSDIMGIPLQEAGIVFSWYMPVITTGIAFGMLFIAGGLKEMQNKESAIYALVSGITAGGTAIIANYAGFTTLTGVFSGLSVMLVVILITKLMGKNILDDSLLTDEEKEYARNFSLLKALSPWTILIGLSVIINVEPFYSILFSDYALPINIGEKMVAGSIVPAIIVKTRIFWQAYLWVLISTLLSMLLLKHDKKTLVETAKITWKRAIRPIFAASIFFSVAYVLNHSGTVIINGLWSIPSNDPAINQLNNMIYVLAQVTKNVTGGYYTLIVPFIGLFGGFVTGSETSSIAMFTKYHQQTSIIVGVDPVIVGAANGIGGGLASVLSPAKIANAAAVVDSPGIEGEIIKKTAPIALLLVWVVSLMTFIFTTDDFSKLLSGIGISVSILLIVVGLVYIRYKKIQMN